MFPSPLQLTRPPHSHFTGPASRRRPSPLPRDLGLESSPTRSTRFSASPKPYPWAPPGTQWGPPTLRPHRTTARCPSASRTFVSSAALDSRRPQEHRTEARAPLLGAGRGPVTTLPSTYLCTGWRNQRCQTLLHTQGWSPGAASGPSPHPVLPPEPFLSGQTWRLNPVHK